jgi:hypothetical protein
MSFSATGLGVVIYGGDAISDGNCAWRTRGPDQLILDKIRGSSASPAEWYSFV